MKFSDRILSRLEKTPEEFSLLKNWIAENLSRYSATKETKSWLPHYRSAREAKMVLFLGLYLPSWEIWEVVARVRDSAWFQKYDGEWEQVQELLEQVTNIDEFQETWSKFSSEDDFFGNFLLECEKFLRRNRKVFKRVDRDRKHPKSRPNRSEYRDKGSLRPYHRRGRIFGDPNPGEDRRRKVSYGHLPDI